MKNRANKAVVITGNLGFIGKHLSEALPDAYGMDKRSIDIPPAYQNLLIADFPQTVDVMIHLAADPLVPDSIEKPFESFENNVVATFRVLEHCRKTGAKLIFTSSCQADITAQNPYALQKFNCEQWIQMYSELYGVEAVVLRLYNVFGEGEHGVISKFLEQVNNDEPLRIFGGQQKRDFVHVDAVVRTIIEAIDKPGGTYEVGSGHVLSIQEIADMISDSQVHEELPVGEPLNLVAPYGVETISVKEYLK